MSYEMKRTVRYAAAVRIACQVAEKPGGLVAAEDVTLWSVSDIEALLRSTGWLWADERQQWIYQGDA